MNGNVEKSASQPDTVHSPVFGTTKLPQKAPNAPCFVPVFAPKKSTVPLDYTRRMTPENRNETLKNRKLTTNHHNSPQNPKTCFIHSQVVRPLLLTFPLFRTQCRKTGEVSWGSAWNRKKPHPRKDGALIICRRSPNLPHTYACSTIGPTRLNFRVRDGNGCDPRGKLTGKVLKSRSRDLPQLNRLGVDVSTFRSDIKLIMKV